MNDYEKEYIECRFIVLGSDKVGKKSLISRILNVPSTSAIRNYDNEMAYKKEIEKLRIKYEKKKKFLEKLQEISDEMTSTEVRNKIKEEKTKSTITNPNVITTSKFQKMKIPKINLDINNGYILPVTTEEIFFSKDYSRPPIPEHPSKLFNVHKSKICIKPFYILPAEKMSYDYNPDDDSDNECDNDLNVSFKGIKNDINQIINNKKTIIEEDKLIGYKITIYNVFLFLYDMGDFNTFEILVHYFDFIESNNNISSLENSICCILGNKKDINLSSTSEQKNIIQDFVKENNLLFYEISTKPYFNFDKFFMDFILNSLNNNHEKLFNEFNFREEFEKIVTNKPTFAKSEREMHPKDLIPGPDYDLNIYSFISTRELNDSLNNKKYRFNKKIFCNKVGPKFIASRSTKDIGNPKSDLIKLKASLLQSKGGLLNKPVKGYTFGVIKGLFNLVQKRKDLQNKRKENLKESIEGDSSLFFKNMNKSKLKGDEPVEEAMERKKQFFEKRINDRKKMIKKLSKIHSNNIRRLRDEEEKRKQYIILSQNIKSLSTSDILTTNNIFYEITDEIIDYNKKRFLDIIYPKNRTNLNQYINTIKRIKKNKKEYSTPAPNAYDIRNNYTDSSRGPTIVGKRKEIIYSKMDPSFPNLKDEFDLIVEKAANTFVKQFRPRFEDVKKEKILEPYIDKVKWKKWEENKLNIEKNGRISKFLENIKRRKSDQLMKLEEIKQQKEELDHIKYEILVKKGYEDPSQTKYINYSLVEESSPKYSLKGRHSASNLNNENDVSNIFPGNPEMMALITNSQLNRPLPNISAIRPRFPRIIFNKAERFNKFKEYEGSMNLFQDGNFGLKTQENFSCKEPLSFPVNRDSIYRKCKNSPSPADYKIKSSFEIIAERGKKISENREKIKQKEILRKIKSIEPETDLKLS